LPLPLYCQLAERIRERIERGELKPGDKIESEKWYEEQFDVSRVTVRKAIQYLEEAGVVERIRSSGSVVTYHRYERPFNRLTSLYEELDASGIRASSKIIEVQNKRANATIAGILGLDVGADTVFIKRIRYADGQVLALQYLTLSAALFPGLDPIRLETESFFHILEKEYNLSVSYADQTLCVKRPSADQTSLLGIGAQDALMQMTRISYAKGEDEDFPVEYSVTYYLPERYELTTRLFR